MKPFIKWRHTLLFSVCLSLLFFTLIRTVTTQRLMFTPISVEMEKVGELKWRWNLSSLNDGIYYLSVGKVFGPCTLTHNGRPIYSNRSAYPGLRKSLLMGSEFRVYRNNAPVNQIELNCEEEPGFSTFLSHKPFLSFYMPAFVTHSWIFFVEFIIGPVCSLILIIYLIGAKRSHNVKGYFEFLAFSIVMLWYTVSLAGFPRFYISGLPASVLHACLRTALSWAFYKLCAAFSKSRKIPDILLGCIILSLVFMGVIKPDKFEAFYIAMLPTFTFVMAMSIYDLTKSKPQTREGFYLREVALLWTFVLISDLITTYLNFGTHPAPVLSAFVTALVLSLKIKSDEHSLKVESVGSKLWLILEGNSSIDKKLTDLTRILFKTMSFPGCSAYIDAFVIGMNDVPLKKFIEIYSDGEKPFAANKRVVSFDEGYGSHMKRVIEKCQPALNLGTQDRKWYINLPIGSHAVINCTGLTETLSLYASESLELAIRIHPIIQSLNHQLTEFASRMSFDLEALRLIKGDGTWEQEVGMIFIDINHYSDNCEKFKDPYSRFVSQLYLPALCQRVRRWAVREGATEGDSAFLLCIKELMQEDCPVTEAVYRTVAEIKRFTELEGADICKARGYDPIQIQIGASAGSVTVICDSFQVRTSGNLVNQTARLQQGASIGGTLVDSNLIKQWPKDGILRFGPEINELVKTKRLRAHEVYLDKKKLNVS